MNNTFIDNFDTTRNYKHTENGALAYRSLDSAVYQMFAQCGAFRQRSDDDCVFLFKRAFEEDQEMALKCLFWSRDVRGGEGERRFFRICYKWLAQNHPETASRNMRFLPFYGRVDDLYCLDGTPLEEEMYLYLKDLAFEAYDELCRKQCSATAYEVFKWLKSCNSSSKTTNRLGYKTCKAFGLSPKEYRKFLSWGRKQTKVLETLMSENHFEDIEFDKIPSKAGLKYRKAFLRNPTTADRYREFATSKNTKVNADTLYPYEIVTKAVKGCHHLFSYDTDTDALDPAEREVINKYWENLPDYLEGKPCKILCMVDTSGSMTWGPGAVAPINVAISLGMYCAERIGGDFKDHYISFSRNPQLVKIEGIDFVDKARRLYRDNLCENTNLCKAFELVREITLNSNPDDCPDTIIVISDMEIDECEEGYENDVWQKAFSINSSLVCTEMETERKRWEACGLTLPHLIYWNVAARHDTFLDKNENVSYVSGFSPVLFKQILSGKRGIDLMMQILLGERYAQIK